MGTNYYAYTKTEPCPHCGRKDPEGRIHIGKSSAGWCFSVHCYDSPLPASWEEWKIFLQSGGIAIKDEYGEDVPFDELVENVENRRLWIDDPAHRWTPEKLKRNNATLGPNGLARHAPFHSSYRTEPGEGTWDHLFYDFS